jgi:hypothetical protein
MAPIALLVLDRSDYGTEGLSDFWRRVDRDESLRERAAPLIRKVPPSERVELLQVTEVELAEQGYTGTASGPKPTTVGGAAGGPVRLRLSSEETRSPAP